MNRLQTRWGFVALTFIVGLFAAMQFGKVSLTLGALQGVYPRPLTTIAALVSLVGIVGILLGVMAGGWVARLGLRRVMIWAMFLGAGLSLLQALLPPLPILFVLRGIEGVSHLALVVAAPPLMAQFSSDKDRPLVMAIWAMFFGVAFAIAAWGLPTLLNAGGLPLVFGLHGGGLALLAVAYVIGVPKTFGPAVPTPKVNVWAAHKAIYSTARLCAPALGFVFYTILFIAAVTFLPQILNNPNLGERLPLISLLGTLLAGRLAQTYRAEAVSIIGFLGSAAFSGTVLLGQDVTVYPLFLMMGFIPGAQFAMIPALNADDGARARATGAIAQMGNVGTVSGTVIFAMLISAFGSMAPVWAMMTFSLIGAVVVAFLWRRCT